MMRLKMSLLSAAYLPECLREHGASERGRDAFFGTTASRTRDDTTEGLS